MPPQDDVTPEASSGWSYLVWLSATVVLVIFSVLMFLTSPTNGDFEWSDAPRHALNGVFVKDLVSALPLADPRAFAEDYYLKYPALSILFYPPLFSFFLAICYAAFGFSHAVAQGGVVFFYFLLGMGCYALARRWLQPAYALAAALLIVGAPEIQFWGRQVMLDIPCYAFLVATAIFFIRFQDQGRTRDLLLTLVFYLAALYTKQTPLFVAAALTVGLVSAHGFAMLRTIRVIGTAALGLVLMVPLVVMHLKFGQVNTASAVGSQRADASRLTLEAWTYYGSVLPEQLGWGTVVLAVAYLVGAVVRPAWRIPRAHMWFLCSWFVSGYLFFSYIMVREPRHDLMALLPVPIFAVLAIRNLASERSALVGKIAALSLAVGLTVWSAFLYPVRYVGGYQEAARIVMDEAPKNGAVLFSGNRDGSFVFNMRAGNRPDLSVARADKFLFRVAIERERGIQDRGMPAARIEDLVKKHAIRYVVFEPDFWPDMPSMAALKALLHDQTKFVAVRRIATSANFRQPDKEIIVYRYLGELDNPPAPLSVELVGIGKTIERK
jgi:hypothetical protein